MALLVTSPSAYRRMAAPFFGVMEGGIGTRVLGVIGAAV